MYLCVCKGIRVSDAVQLTRLGIDTPEALMDAFGFDDGDSCGRCAKYINELARLVKIERYNAFAGRQEPQPEPALGIVVPRVPRLAPPGLAGKDLLSACYSPYRGWLYRYDGVGGTQRTV